MDNLTKYSCIVFAVVVVCYYNSLHCGFVFDDASAVKTNKDLRPHTPLQNLFFNDFWGTPMMKEQSHKSYRPLCVLTFRLNYAFSELEPMSYHLVNMILHGIVSIMYLRVSMLFLEEVPSFVASLLFAVHPVHVEAVTGVVGRAELLSSIFGLGAFLCYAQCSKAGAGLDLKKLLIAFILVTMATLCKETGITIVGVCCVYEIFVAQKKNAQDVLDILMNFIRGKPFVPPWLREAIIRGSFLVFSTMGLLIIRLRVQGVQLPQFTNFDNPAAVAASPARQLTLNYLIPVNAWLLLCPSALCADWSMGTIPLVMSLLDVRNLATLVFYMVLGKFALYAAFYRGKRARALVMSLAFMVLPFIPAANLFFAVGFVVAERVLYTPSMGFCMLVALGFQLLTRARDSETLKKFLWGVLALLVFMHGLKTHVRNFDWQSELLLFKSGLKVNRHNAKLFNNVGHALEGDKKWDEALAYFTKAAEVQPDDVGAHINVGRTYMNLNMDSDAEKAYRKALALMPAPKKGETYTTRINPNYLNVYLNMGNMLAKNVSRLEEADTLYKRAISMRADYIEAYINRGDVLMKLNRTKEAQQTYETALKYQADNADLYYNLGVVLLERGDRMAAYQQFELALKHDPDHKQTLFNSAVLIQEAGEPKLRPQAYKRLKQLLKLDPDDAKIYFNLGMLYTDDKRFEEAVTYFKKAIELQEDFRGALFNLALLLSNDLSKPLDAVPFLQQLLKFYPNHTKGLILMGDINVNHLKDIDAAETNFRKILEYDPYDVQANHNLCVVFVERGDLMRAEKCLVYALSLAPHEDYIKNHLNTVRNRIYHAQKAHQEQQRMKAQEDAQQQQSADQNGNGRTNGAKVGQGET
ncbi:protein O-mannosyl-transferase TMTC3-like [Lineus longissimus]|uniref:protein O-mannosyl-transferase TMTC3-like n=1 Tax=Lineus longissimus TaxID=88925 RepID=UPI002B4F1B71